MQTTPGQCFTQDPTGVAQGGLGAAAYSAWPHCLSEDPTSPGFVGKVTPTQLAQQLLGGANLPAQMQLGTGASWTNPVANQVARQPNQFGPNGLMSQLSQQAPNGLMGQLSQQAPNGLMGQLSQQATNGLTGQLNQQAANGLMGHLSQQATNGLTGQLSQATTNGSLGPSGVTVPACFTSRQAMQQQKPEDVTSRGQMSWSRPAEQTGEATVDWRKQSAEEKSNWWSEKAQPYQKSPNSRWSEPNQQEKTDTTSSRWDKGPQSGSSNQWQPQRNTRTWPDEAQGQSPQAVPEQLKAPDWSTWQRKEFRRTFVPIPHFEDAHAEQLRQHLGISVEDRGPLPAAPRPVMTFEELGVLPQYLLEGLRAWNITAPMPVQAQALPCALTGCNLVGIAQTGSGKTLAYLLPAIVQIEAQESVPKGEVTPIALILAPTRELAVQITEEACKVLRSSRNGAHKNGIWASSVYGGGKKYEQIKNLQWGSEIVAATPGRLIDFLTSRVVSLQRVTMLVLDEADRMLIEGFAEEVATISAQIRPERQVLFFSATWSAEVQALAAALCHNSRPLRLSVGQEQGSCLKAARKARHGITQDVVVVDYPDDYEKQVAEKRKKLDDHLHEVLWSSEDHKVLVFVSQKTYADELAQKLWDAGFQAAAMHGGKSQEARLSTLDRFRKGELRLLIATDVIGRGIDIPSVSHVVIFDMGGVEDYIHRIGRTARGKDGTGHALVFFEYWHKEPGIAAELGEALAASGQRVPPELMKIADEVASGQRQVWKGNYQSKWSGKRWASHECSKQSAEFESF